MTNYIDSKTRIKTGFLFIAYGHAIFLQRKVGYFWVTKAWTYPQIFDNRSYEQVVDYLLREESELNPGRESEQKRIGELLMKEGLDK